MIVTFRSSSLLVCFLCIFGGISTTAFAQEAQSEESLTKCLAAQKAVEREVALPRTNAWTGTYKAMMSKFSIAPVSGFSLFRGSDYKYWSCAWGRVEWSDGKLKLIPDRDVPEFGLRGVDLDWVPVPWGERHYLIATPGLLDFVNAVNIGFEPSGPLSFMGGSYYKLEGDADRKVAGFPALPAPFDAYLLKNPIRGRVVSVGAYRTEFEDNGRVPIRITKLTVNIGSRHGVKVGMKFLTYKPKFTSEDVVITEVHQDTSEAETRQRGTIYSQPSTKWEISSSLGNKK